MQEIELKCQVPVAQRAAVRRAVATAAASTTRLQARYFDTPDRRLAAAGMALRLRREGSRWVQTLKGRGDGVMVRLEHECVLPATRSAPSLDISRHDDTPAGVLLRRVLTPADAALLAETFSTDIRRTHRRVRSGGAVIELALDEGHIRAGPGSDKAPRSQAVFELEFELATGPPTALPALVRRWSDRHGLWVDPRSKAERGERLARGRVQVPATRGEPAAVRADRSGPEAWASVVGGALRQVLANAAELAEGLGAPEHLHQCRVGLRRLRCALRDLAPLINGQPALPALAACSAMDDGLGALARQLGLQRDRDALAEHWWPRWRDDGCPEGLAMPAAETMPDVGALLRDPATTGRWLTLIAAVQVAGMGQQAAAPAESSPNWPDLMRRRWRHLYRQVTKDGADYERLDDAARHRVRKRLKRLRYAVEAGRGLAADKPAARFLAAVRRAQEALGDDHDLVTAQALLAQVPAAQRNAAHWFVTGWLAGRRPGSIRQCREALASLADAPHPWRRRWSLGP